MYLARIKCSGLAYIEHIEYHTICYLVLYCYSVCCCYDISSIVRQFYIFYLFFNLLHHIDRVLLQAVVTVSVEVHYKNVGRMAKNVETSGKVRKIARRGRDLTKFFIRAQYRAINCR